MTNRLKLTTKNIKTFFDNIVAFGGNVTRAAESINVKTSTVYTRAEKDKIFSEEFEKAKKLGALTMRDELSRRAFNGVVKDVYYQGEKVGTEKQYSDTLGIFLTKGDLKQYSERVELTGQDGGPIKTASITKQMTDEEAAQLFKDSLK